MAVLKDHQTMNRASETIVPTYTHLSFSQYTLNSLKKKTYFIAHSSFTHKGLTLYIEDWQRRSG